MKWNEKKTQILPNNNTYCNYWIIKYVNNNNNNAETKQNKKTPNKSISISFGFQIRGFFFSFVSYSLMSINNVVTFFFPHLKHCYFLC